MYKLVIFDFDGTLADTVEDVALCFNEALNQCGFPMHTIEEICDLVGGNLEVIISKLLPSRQASTENIDRVKKLYREIYYKSPKRNTHLYPGIMELLQELKKRNVQLAVNSNKGQDLLEQMVEKMFPEGIFDVVVGYSEKYPPKPDPCGVDMILEKCSCTAAETVYIGDGMSDIKTAQNAGVACIFVAWGQGRINGGYSSDNIKKAENIIMLKKYVY